MEKEDQNHILQLSPESPNGGTINSLPASENVATTEHEPEPKPMRNIEEVIGFQIDEEDAMEIAKSQKQKHSTAWAHFDIQPGNKIAICKHCRISKYESKGAAGTSNLHSHLRRCDEYKKVKIYESPNKQINQIEYRRMLAEATLAHGYSFSWVEHARIKKLHTRLSDNIKPISRNTVKKDCLAVHKEMKADLKKVLTNLPGRICCTSDLWTSINTKSYMCLIAQYIDEHCKIQSKVLCFRHCPPPHGGFELAQETRIALSEWGIEKKVFSLTLDNATNNDKMMKTLKQRMFKDAVCDGKYVRIRCSAHILNLIVKDGLILIKLLISRVRDGVRYIVGSEGRIEKFVECLKNLEVPISSMFLLDVLTRWNSTYIMLDKAFRYRDALTYYFFGVDDGSDYTHGFREWAKVEKICSILEPFNAITEMFSGSQYPTSNLFFPKAWKIHNRLESLTISADIEISAATVNMLEKFDKYWADYVPILKFAIILDPRFKLRFVLFALSKQHGITDGKKNDPGSGV